MLAELGLDVPLRTRLVGELTLAQRQLLEIAKALLTEPRVLILDEPTSALGAQSTELLLDVLRVLRDRQVGVVFVSHILEDVMALCDEVTVLRDGEVAMSARPRAGLTVPAIVDAMLGEREATVARPDEKLREAVAEAVDVESAAAGSSCATRRSTGALEPLTLDGAAGRDRRARGRRRRRPSRRARAGQRAPASRPGTVRAARRQAGAARSAARRCAPASRWSPATAAGSG